MAQTNIDLGEIDGIPVAGTTIAIRNAGDGLSKALKVDPKLIHHKETVYVVLECECVDVQFPEIPDANEVMRKHVLKAGVATIVDRRVVIAAMDATRDKLQAAQDAKTNATPLDLEYNPPGEDHDPDKLDDAPEPKRASASPAAGARPKRPTRKGTAAKKSTAKKAPAKKAAAKGGHLASVPDPAE